MKNYKISFVVAFLAFIAAVSVWWWLQRNPYAVSRVYIEETNRETARMRQEASNPAPEQLAALISQAEKMQPGSDAMVMEVKFYGKVIDQYGNSVADMKVSYDAGNAPFTRGSGPGFVMTDSDGYFVIANVKANILDIRALEKKNYEARGLVSFRGYNQGGGDGVGSWADYSKDKPYVFHASKIEKYAETKTGKDVLGFESDGRVYKIDLSKSPLDYGSMIQEGDLTISFLVDDKAWQVKIGAIDGGLQESSDEYMNLAPEFGYQSEILYGGTDKNKANFKRQYYFKSRGGRFYGTATLEVRPYGGSDIRIAYTINLEGGRELAVRPKE